jgi:hypothetical protein
MLTAPADDEDDEDDDDDVLTEAGATSLQNPETSLNCLSADGGAATEAGTGG